MEGLGKPEEPETQVQFSGIGTALSTFICIDRAFLSPAYRRLTPLLVSLDHFDTSATASSFIYKVRAQVYQRNCTADADRMP